MEYRRGRMGSFMIAFFIDIPALNQVVISFIPELSGKIMTVLHFFVACLFGVYCLLNAKKFNISMNQLLLGGFVGVGYLITQILSPYSDLRIIDFCIYTIMSIFIVAFYEIDSKTFLRFLMFLPCSGILSLNRIFATNTFKYETITMGLSYAFMPAIVAAISYFFLYFKKGDNINKFIDAIALIINLSFLLKILQFGSRGPVLCFLCSFLFFYCFEYDENFERIRIKGEKCLLISIILLLLINYFWEIALFLENIMDASGLKINAINKFFRLMNSSGDVSNGRLDIYLQSFQGFLQSPIWGHGYSTTMYNLGFVYPHNFVLQLLYDGGLLLFVPLVYLCMKGKLNKKNRLTFDDFALVSSLILMSVPGAMFSGNLWENSRLWLMFSVLVTSSKAIDNYELSDLSGG